MAQRFSAIVMGLVGIGLLVAFLAVPVVKLKDLPMLIVILIGIAAAVYSFVDVVRGKEEA
jgi:hypothetical protein